MKIHFPRGGGKSAQRRMIEYKCVDSDVLAITYDKFDFAGIEKASDVKLHHHLRKILRISIIALLIDIQSEPTLRNVFSKTERDVFVKLVAEHLDGITNAEFQTSLSALRSLKEKFKAFWNEWLPAIGLGINALSIMLKPWMDVVSINEISAYQTEEFRVASSLKYQLELVVNLSKKLGWKSIYILIDRVDESELTGNNAKDSFELLEPLLKDLQLLEMPGVAFKFFLWDLLQPYCESVVRMDRIKQETLDWNRTMLSRLWQRRLETYSDNRVLNLREFRKKQDHT